LATSNSGTSGVTPLALPNDPYFANQWNLLNTGQIANDYLYNPTLQPIFGVAGNDIDVAPVWDMGITGTGVLVAVNDVGVQLDHPDLEANISPTFRLDVLGGDTNPSPNGSTATDAHGTEVAGIIAAVQNNGIGTTGVAPGATLAPVRIIPVSQVNQVGSNGVSDLQIANALILNGAPVDVSNNSWGPDDSSDATGTNRAVAGPGPLTQQALQQLATQGRNGKGEIIVFASGNNAGPINSPGFQSFGNWGSAGSNGYNNSRYTISVGAVDHDGSLNNADGTQTLYSEAGPSTLVVAPSGSNSIDIGGNTGTGSGIYTTDLTGSAGANQPALANGLEVDGDFFPDPNYVSRFNGTSAAAPEVSGVVALMLQANPNLTYRDVEEILVRSARQDDPTDPSWIVNGNPLFRDPVPSVYNDQFGNPGQDDLASNPDPIGNPMTNPAPAPLYTNGAGYTVSQGRTPLASEYGYGHGEVDAKLAVELAQQWTAKNQSSAPELTWTTFVQNGDRKIRGAQKSDMDSGQFYIPGSLVGVGQTTGFADFFNEFFADMPFSETPPPQDTRGGFEPVDVPVTSQGQNNLMDVEWVEVKLDLRYANAADLNDLRIALQSPDGTISDLTNYQIPGSALPATFQSIPFNLLVTPPGVLDSNADGNGVFSWIYSTNRDWGERSDSEPLVDPANGKPVLDANGQPVFKPWELHFENY
jgi:subtilisin family serine protease